MLSLVTLVPENWAGLLGVESGSVGPSADAKHSPLMQLPFIRDPKSMTKHFQVQVPFQFFGSGVSTLAPWYLTYFFIFCWVQLAHYQVNKVEGRQVGRGQWRWCHQACPPVTSQACIQYYPGPAPLSKNDPEWMLVWLLQMNFLLPHDSLANWRPSSWGSIVLCTHWYYRVKTSSLAPLDQNTQGGLWWEVRPMSSIQ